LKQIPLHIPLTYLQRSSRAMFASFLKESKKKEKNISNVLDINPHTFFPLTFKEAQREH